MNLIELAKKRYSCKAYDPNKKITSDKLADLATVLEVAPSSINLQPVKTLFISNPDVKQAIAESVVDTVWTFNQNIMRDCSHLVVLAINTLDVDKQLQRLVNQDVAAKRVAAEKAGIVLDRLQNVVKETATNQAELEAWYSRQAYLSAGQLLLAAESLGLNSTPMEGFVPEKVDSILDLPKKNLKSVLMIALGYRDAAKDYNHAAPKSRFPQKEKVEFID